MKKALFVALLCLSPALSFAQTWSVTGRASQIFVDRRQYGDVNVSIGLTYPDPYFIGGSPISVYGLCSGSQDATCYALAQSPSCNWATVPSVARAAILSVIGGAWCGPDGHPTCFTATGVLPWGETYATQVWSCSGGPTAANCNVMSGYLEPGLLITTFQADYGSCSL